MYFVYTFGEQINARLVVTMAKFNLEIQFACKIIREKCFQTVSVHIYMYVPVVLSGGAPEIGHKNEMHTYRMLENIFI